MKQSLTILAIFFALLTSCNHHDEPDSYKEGRILVLMYHRIVNGEPVNSYERSLEDFQADIRYITDNNINVISFSEMEEKLASGKMPDGESVILTFDDGDHSWYSLVRPLLLKYRLKATFFLWTSMIEHDSFITREEIEDMSHYTAGNGLHPFIFGSHTCSHAFLLQNKGTFSDDKGYNSFLDYELGVSKELIEEHTPGNVSALSLPYGDGAGDAEIIAAASRNGYKFIRTSVWAAITSPETSLFQIPGFPMLDTTKSEVIGKYLGLK